MMMFRKMLLAAGLLTSIIAVASAGTDVGYPHIEVTGYGKAAAVADRCKITVGVKVSDKNLTVARKNLDAQVKTLVDTVAKATKGQAEVTEDLLPMLDERIMANRKTNSYNAEIAASVQSSGGASVREYELKRNVFIHTAALNRIGEIIDLSMNSGANCEPRVEFFSSQLQDLNRKAALDACRDAAERAKVLAEGMNVEITEPTIITDFFNSRCDEDGLMNKNDFLKVEVNRTVKVIYRIFNKKK